MTTKVIRTKVGDHFVHTTVMVTTETIEVDFNDIVEAVQVDPDECFGETPWDMCDGYDHTATSINRMDAHRYEMESARGYCWHGGDRERVIITMAEHVDTDLFKWYRDQGASKQVAAEMVALSLRKRLDQLTHWYEHGWQWWYVHGQYRGYEDSVGGIDDYGYARDSVREEIAMNITAALEDDDYIVTNKPVVPNEDPGRRAFLKHNRNLFSWIN